MTSLLNDVDTIFGHRAENTPNGPVYSDDRSPVDFGNPRACFGCKQRCASGQHDACISDLPSTKNACCGHGQERTPRGNLAGYVALDDGRTFRFSGTAGGDRIRTALAAAIAGEALPEGFVFDEKAAWWTGLSDYQRGWVHAQTVPAIAETFQRVLGRAVCAEFLEGTKPWWEGCSEDEKQLVWAAFPGMIDGLAEQARLLPTEPPAADAEQVLEAKPAASE